jgi:hypothetical protein
MQQNVTRFWTIQQIFAIFCKWFYVDHYFEIQNYMVVLRGNLFYHDVTFLCLFNPFPITIRFPPKSKHIIHSTTTSFSQQLYKIKCTFNHMFIFSLMKNLYLIPYGCNILCYIIDVLQLGITRRKTCFLTSLYN